MDAFRRFAGPPAGSRNVMEPSRMANTPIPARAQTNRPQEWQTRNTRPRPDEPARSAESDVVADIKTHPSGERQIRCTIWGRLAAFFEIEPKLGLVGAKGHTERTLPDVGGTSFPGKAEVQQIVPVEAPFNGEFARLKRADHAEFRDSEARGETVLASCRARNIGQLQAWLLKQQLHEVAPKRDPVIMLVVQYEGTVLQDVAEGELYPEQPTRVLVHPRVDLARSSRHGRSSDEVFHQVACRRVLRAGIEQVAQDLRVNCPVSREQQPVEPDEAVTGGLGVSSRCGGGRGVPEKRRLVIWRPLRKDEIEFRA